MHWQTTRFQIDLTQPKVMGIVNVTPDSFSDGGQRKSVHEVLKYCEKLLQDGADILDIGGESTRPGAKPLPMVDELERVLPILREALKLGVPVSVDTYKPQVMQTVLDLGADIINDIWALRWQDSTETGQTWSSQKVVSIHPSCGICVMHMHLQPQTMQLQPMQGDVVLQVLSFLEQATQELLALGVDKSRIVVDPGIGFGKTVAQNFLLLSCQNEILDMGYPVLAGWSRKSSLAGMAAQAGRSSALSADERLAPSLAAALLAAERGAAILRVHDVKETVQVLNVLNAIRSPSNN